MRFFVQGGRFLDDNEWGKEMLRWLESLGTRKEDWDLAKGGPWQKIPFVVDIRDKDECLIFALRFGQYIIPEPPLGLPKKYWVNGVKVK
jgi:hypothetical protein